MASQSVPVHVIILARTKNKNERERESQCILILVNLLRVSYLNLARERHNLLRLISSSFAIEPRKNLILML